MMRTIVLEVIRNFKDVLEGKNRSKGEVFEANEQRAIELVNNPNRLVKIKSLIHDIKEEIKEQTGITNPTPEVVNEIADGVKKDFSKLSYNELKAMTKELGYKGSMKKENLLKFLTK